MRADLTDITLVVDRSGSMEAIRADAEGGVNAFIREQAALPGSALLTLVQFDTQYEFVHRGVPMAQVGPYRLVPRGNTALLDAMGRAINETGDRLERMKPEDRPGLVVFAVVTDGLENSSQEFTKPKIKEMIQHQQDVYKWHFNFLAANQDAFAEAGELGIARGGAGCWSPDKAGMVYHMVSAKVGRMRAECRSGEAVSNEFTDNERKEMS